MDQPVLMRCNRDRSSRTLQKLSVDVTRCAMPNAIKLARNVDARADRAGVRPVFAVERRGAFATEYGAQQRREDRTVPAASTPVAAMMVPGAMAENHAAGMRSSELLFRKPSGFQLADSATPSRKRGHARQCKLETGILSSEDALPHRGGVHPTRWHEKCGAFRRNPPTHWRRKP